MRVEANKLLNRAKAIELNGILFKSGENLMEDLSKLFKVEKLNDINPTRDIDNFLFHLYPVVRPKVSQAYSSQPQHLLSTSPNQ